MTAVLDHDAVAMAGSDHDAVAAVRSARTRRRRRTGWTLAALALGVVGLFFVDVLLSSYRVSLPDFVRILGGERIGAATALAGPMLFVGLVVPHLVRALVGADYRWILPASMLLAPVLLVGADVAGRVVLPPGEIQAGVMTAVVGAPVFIWLVRRGRQAQL